MALQSLRKGASGWVAKIFLVILMFSFLIWGIADVFRGFGASSVASVGSTEIAAADFRAQYLDRIQQIGRQTGRGLTQDQARAFGLDRQVLNQMIADATLDAQAARLGLAVGDAQIAREIRDNPNFRRPGAAEFDPAYFDQLLRANNLTEQRFIAAEKQRVLREQVIQSFGTGLTAPQALLDAVERFEGEQRSASYILVTAAAAGALPAPTEEELRTYFEAHKITFRAPEYRKVTLLALTPEALAGAVEVSEDEARAAYDRNPARFGVPEKREVQQIVFAKREDAAAADARIRAGDSFAAIATERGLTSADTDLGLVARTGIIDPSIADAAFSLPEGATSGPVDGRFGTALVHVARVEPGAQRPFASAKDELSAEIALDKARRLLLDRHDAVEDERAAGATLAETAQKLGLKLATLDAVDRAGRDPAGQAVEVPGGSEVITGAFATQPGIENDTVQLPQNGGFVWYETDAVIPARDRTFDEAKAAVTERWTDEEITKAVAEKAKALLAKAEAGTPLGQVAAEADLPLQVAEGLRRGRADGNFSPQAVQAVFDAKEGGFGDAPAAKAPGRVVFQVDKIILPPPAARDPRLAEELSRQMENDLLVSYLGALQKELGVRVNERVLAQSVGAGQTN